MFNILKNVIRNGGMPLTQVNERIETMYISGRLNSQERSELIELMHSKADPANETGDWKKMYEALVEKYNELEERLNAIEKGLGLNEQPDGEEDETGYPAWEPWDGVSNRYQKGTIVTHIDKVWESMFEGQNVWEPGAPGIDERYWKEVIA